MTEQPRHEGEDPDDRDWEDREDVPATILVSDNPTLTEVAKRVHFPVYAPARLPENTSTEVSIDWPGGYPEITLRVRNPKSRTNVLVMEQAKYLDSDWVPGLSVEYEGRRMWTCCPPTVGNIAERSRSRLKRRSPPLVHLVHDVDLRLEGADVHLRSSELSINALVLIAASLRRVSLT